MRVHILENRVQGGYTTFGSTWKKGELKPETDFALRDVNGKELPVQSRITAYWPDGSVKWAAHTADSGKMGKEAEIQPVDRLGNAGSGTLAETVNVEELENEYRVTAARLKFCVPKSGCGILRELYINGKKRADRADCVLLLEKRSMEGNVSVSRVIEGIGRVDQVAVEEAGQVCCVLRLSGTHILGDTGEEAFPFVLRIKAGADSDELEFTHTFLVDIDEKKDFLKGIGVRFDCPVEGANYNRHVKFGLDHGCFHEAMNLLLTWRPQVPAELYQAQIEGNAVDLSGQTEEVRRVPEQLPAWDCYELTQESASYFRVRKKTAGKECCLLDCIQGFRAPGTAAFGGENGGMMFARRDFWQKYPSGFTFDGLSGGSVQASCWFWAPGAESMDFRHYAEAGYDQTYYEGFPEVGATPYGIANTNTFSIRGFDKLIPEDEELAAFGCKVQKPAVYVGTPEYYHEHKAFGFWSLPSRETQMERWLEDQLDQAVAFYENEVEQRSWYGLFNYGDFMHTYDRARHCWRYDMGGYAWQNTELVPTLWLWLAFLRTGREDIFSLAEAMSRHCSEVDTYHFGPLKGLGSRHNVRHWGCSCKEARIAMAGHHRYYYFLTGDHRLEDVFEDVKDADQALENMDPLRYFYKKEEMTYPTHARSGPDWSSCVSDWMTRWERFNDEEYRDRILTGLEDIKKTPLKLVSGPDFEYDPKTHHLFYPGEKGKGSTHLQICMGAAQVWLELSELLEDEQWRQMLADYGRFYYLDKETQLAESDGAIGDREFSIPFMAGAMGAYGAAYRKERWLADRTWQLLLGALIGKHEQSGFVCEDVPDGANRECLKEIPWISTNFAAQWCLNIIMALEFIREELPEDMEGALRLVQELPEELFRKA